MELKVISCGKEVGTCEVYDDGLYWQINCVCSRNSKDLVGLYGAGHYLGLPERSGNKMQLNRRISKASLRGFPPESGALLLLPRQKKTVNLCGKAVTGFLEEEENCRIFRVPFHERTPHPCIHLFCFFGIEHGFWKLACDGTDVFL